MSGIFWGILLFVTVLDARTAMDSASQAVEMCLKSVIPSLLPMMFLGGLLTGSLGGRFGLYLAGILGGYPVGAKCVAQVYARGSMTENDARRMLGYCNNPGPAFLFGILGPMFPSSLILWAIWFIVILSSVLTSLTLPGKGTSVPVEASHLSPAENLNSVLRALAGICGWVILFKVLIGFGEKWFFQALPKPLPLLLAGLLELTNGCLGLTQINDISSRFLLAVLFLTSGGICVAMQTASVTGKLGLGMYIPGKVIQTAWAVLLATLMRPFLFPGAKFIPIIPLICALILFIFRFFLSSSKNNSSNLSPAVV